MDIVPWIVSPVWEKESTLLHSGSSVLSLWRLAQGLRATIKKCNDDWLEDRTTTFGGDGHSAMSLDGVKFSEGSLLLQALNGFVMVVTAEGYVFYASPTIQDYLGFHQSDVVHQSVFELIHTDDRAMFRRQLHFALNPTEFSSDQDGEGMQSSSDITSNIVTYDPQHIPPENSSFLERSFCCRFRCLLDNSSGFLALNFRGRLKYLHGQNKMAEDGTMAHPHLALFVIAMPIQAPSILEIRTKTLIFQTKHKLDFQPMGIDTRGKVVLGYTEMELCTRGSGYQFIHAADMMHCADNHIRMIKTGESGFTVFRLLTKAGIWVWVQANARLVYKGGRPDFIIARQRALTNEEGEEHLRQRKMQLPFHFATGEGVLYETTPTLDMADISGGDKAFMMRKMLDQKLLDPKSLLGSILQQDKSVYIQPPDSQVTLDSAFMDSHALVNVPSSSWQQGAPKSNCRIKEEANVIAMIDTLEQIITNGSLQDMDMNTMELKEWENTLLRMNIDDSDISDEFNDILNNDILTYVEEALFNGNGLGQSMSNSEPVNPLGSVPPNGFPANPLSNQNAFVGVPESLPVEELQNPVLPVNQSFSHQSALLSDPQNQVITDNPQASYLGMGGQSLQVAGNGVRGLQQLPHVGLQVPMGLQGPTQIQPTLQQMQPGGMFTQSVGLTEPISKNVLGQSNQISLNATLSGPCAQLQNQVRHKPPDAQTMFNPAKLNSFGHLPQKQMQTAAQAMARQVHPNTMALPFQSQQQAGLTAQQITFQQQSSVNKSNHIVSGQENGWVPSIPNSNFADNLLEACTPNVLAQRDLVLEPEPGACLQGHFSLQTQNNQRLQPWQQQQQQLPTTLPNSHQHPANCYSQIPEFKRNPLVGILPQNSQHCSTGYGPQKTPNEMYPPQVVLVDNTVPSTNSCMFESSSSTPVNGMQFNRVALATSLSSRENENLTHSQSQPQASCYFQRNSTEPIMGSSAIQQEALGIAPLSCKMAPGFSPESLMAPQQYLNYNGPTQMPTCLLEENGSLSIPSLTDGTTLFSEDNQTNCSDF
ncbi:hypothetical protein AAFF_G00353020 [Aldrovandia affinis]|uniref:PAS domain-containing protein n=1 Tax=Aldrovandia affinis TaxID=143900 RepID=A0AAD7WNU1_9TELE|nr:hypothetical protein AAFF_G00353020 [Aldrovandia affinis]